MMSYDHHNTAGLSAQNMQNSVPSSTEPELRRIHNSLQKANEALAAWVGSLGNCADKVFGALPQSDTGTLRSVTTGEIGEIHDACDQLHNLIAELGNAASRFSRLV